MECSTRVEWSGNGLYVVAVLGIDHVLFIVGGQVCFGKRLSHQMGEREVANVVKGAIKKLQKVRFALCSSEDLLDDVMCKF